MKKGALIVCLIIVVLIVFRLFCGIFVIQPLGFLPEGATIIYWRGLLNIPFVASADGLLDKSGGGVSLFGRVLVIGYLAEPIIERKIIILPYSESLYLWSTGRKKYEKY